MAGLSQSQILAGFNNPTFNPSYSGGYNTAVPAIPPTAGFPTPISPQTSQDSSIAGNLSNVASIASLASGIGGASGAGGAANLQQALPGGQAGLESTLNLGEGLEAGQIPQSTINLLQQQAAERGVATGSPNSPNSNAAYLQALGLTANQLQQQGVADVASAVGQAPTGPQFNPQSQLLTPGEEITADRENAALRAAPAAAASNLAAEEAGLAGGGVAAPGSFSLGPASKVDLGLGADPGTVAGGPGWGYQTPTTNTTGANYQPPTGNAYGGGPENWVSNGDGTSYNSSTGQMRDDYTGELIGGSPGNPQYPAATDDSDWATDEG